MPGFLSKQQQKKEALTLLVVKVRVFNATMLAHEVRDAIIDDDISMHQEVHIISNMFHELR